MLIGLLGNAGAGKDVASKYLVQEHNFYSIALADPMKIYCQWMFEWSVDQLWGPSEKRNAVDDVVGVSPRVVLQNLGDWARTYKEDAYINLALQRVFMAQHGSLKDDPLFGMIPISVLAGRLPKEIKETDCVEHIVISDVRFKNEVSRIRDAGGEIIRLDRVWDDKQINEGFFGHQSEVEQHTIDSDMIDYTVKNWSTKTYLYRQLDEIINGHCGDKK